MTIKQSLENRIRGWFPSEPKMPITQKTIKDAPTSAYRWTAVALVVGSLAGALLGAVGSLAGLTDGVGMFLWPILVGLAVGVCVGSVACYETKKLKRPRTLEHDNVENF